MIDDPSDAIPNKTGSPDPAEYANASDNPADWELGEGPMTSAQTEYLRRLCLETGTEFNSHLSRKAADEEIDRLIAERPRASA